MEKIIILIGEKRVQIIILKSGQVRRVDPRPGRSRAGTGRVEEKQGKEKSGVTRLTQSKILLQPVDFCFVFFTKTTSFWFF